MLEYGLVLVAGILFFLSACLLGANNVALAFGPAIGAKVISYKTAAPTAAVCAAFGAVVFGVRSVPFYGGYLRDWQELQDFPEMAQEALLWPQVSLIGWQLLSLYYRVPGVHHLAVAAGLAGVATVYPGWGSIDWGSLSSSMPYLSGFGTVYLPVLLVPLLTGVIVACIFLPIRTFLLRADDPFFTTLWANSIIAAFTGMANMCYVLYALTNSWHFNHLPPQGVVLLLCAFGIISCLFSCALMRISVRWASRAALRADPVKRASLLGLDDDLMSSLHQKVQGTGLKGRIADTYRQLFERDIVVFIKRDDTLLRIHNGGEEFSKPAEDCFALLQLTSCGLLSVGHGAITLNRAVSLFATVLHIGRRSAITPSAPVSLALRFIGAAGLAISILLFGWRFVPVAGVEISKMSPFRSFTVVMASIATASIVYPLGLGAGGPTYINITAVVALGLIEGTSHVNWRKVAHILGWWLGTLIPLFLITAALFGQGSAPPSQSNMQELAAANATLVANIERLSAMGVTSPALKALLLNTTQLTVLVEQVAAEFQAAVQQALTAYRDAHARCTS